MASIVYVTDKNMLEYHRLNGNETMNFWRPMSQKNIRDFHIGDLIFFLTKIKEKGRGNEKGVVGYGRYSKMNNMTFEQMWKVYGNENGYSSKDKLEKAITNLTSNKELPEMLNCIYVTDVLFFNEPIYLSTFGVNVPSTMESYIYLYNKEKEDVTYELLKIAKEVGVDIWAAAMNNKVANVLQFEEELALHQVSLVQKKIGDFIYSEYEEKQNRKIVKDKLREHRWIYRLKYSEYALMTLENMIPIIEMSLIVSVKEKERTKLLVGHLKMWEIHAEKDWTINVITNEKVYAEISTYFVNSQIKFIVTED